MEHLAKLDLSENSGHIEFQIMKNHYTTVFVLQPKAKKIFWDIYLQVLSASVHIKYSVFILSNVPV